jgi:hypothetical protein
MNERTNERLMAATVDHTFPAEFNCPNIKAIATPRLQRWIDRIEIGSKLTTPPKHLEMGAMAVGFFSFFLSFFSLPFLLCHGRGVYAIILIFPFSLCDDTMNLIFFFFFFFFFMCHKTSSARIRATSRSLRRRGTDASNALII